LQHHQKSEDNDTRLQSLRGLAALCVIVGHCLITFPNGRIEDANFHLSLATLPLAFGQMLFQQNTAVVLFYVLSGYVLALSLRRERTRNLRGYFGFLIKRAARIYPAMLVSVIAGFVLTVATSDMHFSATTSWFNSYFQHGTSAIGFLLNAAGIRTNYNPVLCSIQVELVLALVLPVLVWAVAARTNLIADALITVVLIVASLAIWRTTFWPAVYAYCFYLGIVSAKLRNQHASLVARIPIRLSLFIFGAVLIVVDFGYNLSIIWMPYKVIVNAVISFGLITVIACNPASFEWLKARSLASVGDKSYSLYVFGYIIQIGVVIATLKLFGIDVRPADVTAFSATCLITAATLVVTLLVSTLSYRRIEVPAVRLGRLVHDHFMRASASSIANRLASFCRIGASRTRTN